MSSTQKRPQKMRPVGSASKGRRMEMKRPCVEIALAGTSFLFFSSTHLSLLEHLHIRPTHSTTISLYKRGPNGWSHLSCLSKFCSQRSEDVWTGKRSEEGLNYLSMGRPWESCSNCKQWFSGKWRGMICFSRICLVAVLSSHNVLIYEQLISQQNSSGPQKAW